MFCLNIKHLEIAPAVRFNAHRICILGAPNSSSSCAWHAVPYTVRFLLPFRYLYQNQQHSTLLTQKTVLKKTKEQSAFSIWIRDLRILDPENRSRSSMKIASKKGALIFLAARFFLISIFCVCCSWELWDASWRNNCWKWEASSESVQTIKLLKVETYPN